MSGAFVHVPQCERCWFRAHQYAPHTTIRVAHAERCHTCGHPTVAGIFIRVRADAGPAAQEPQLVLEPGDVVYTTAGGVARQWAVTDDGYLVDEGRRVSNVVGDL